MIRRKLLIIFFLYYFLYIKKKKTAMNARIFKIEKNTGLCAESQKFTEKVMAGRYLIHPAKPLYDEQIADLKGFIDYGVYTEYIYRPFK